MTSRLTKRACAREFRQGSIVINPKVGILTHIEKTSPKGSCFFLGTVFQGKPLRVSENARVSQLNKKYFRRATIKEQKKIERRFSF